MQTTDFSIRDLREELKLNLEAFAAEVGVSSKGYMSRIERGEPCSVKVALAIEAISGGRIDAAGLCEDVRLSRHALTDTAPQHTPSTGKTGKMSGAEPPLTMPALRDRREARA